MSTPTSFRRPRFIWVVFTLFAANLIVAKYGQIWLIAIGLDWAAQYPDSWTLPLKDWVSAAMDWLVDDAHFGLFSFTDLTRTVAWLIEQPYEFVRALLADGFMDGPGRRANQIVPPLSWLTIVAIAVLLGHYSKDKMLGLLVGVAVLYLAIFGQWESSMVTLSSVIIAVPIGVVGGLLIGIWAYRSLVFRRLLIPVLDLMQTVPIFAYLVPILFMFGFGPVSALVATVIYAMPPMIRVTIIALEAVSPEIKDFGVMAGCNRRQMTWRILVPASISSLMVGVNQVIMLSLNMVIIASMIGAGGLGFDVLSSLRRLDIGGGFEAGIAIVVLAIALDRLSQSFAQKGQSHRQVAVGNNFFAQHKRTTFLIVFLGVVFILGRVAPFFQTYPESLWLTTGEFWNRSIKHLNINYFDMFEAVKLFFLNNFLLPIKRFFLGLPWLWAFGMIIFLGWYFGGRKLAVMNAVMVLFIASNGMWEKAMITVYLCGSSVVIASFIGIPLGVLAATNRSAGKVIGVIVDTLQTLPSFVYLIPVIMLFRIGDFTAMIAIVLYALVPAVRYTAHGVRSVNPDLIEAGVVAGCTRRQLLTRIQLPLALPEILLGINQTIMLALSMLVITALVGTRDLGQEVYVALTKADTGRGLVAGFSIAFIAMIADRIVHASARRARIRYGMEE